MTAELSEARGNPGHRNRPVASVTLLKDIDLEPPVPLIGLALEMWNRLVPLMSQTRILRQTDAGELAAYCSDTGEYWHASKMLESEGSVQMNAASGLLRLNPWYRIRDSARRRMLAGADRLGLTPSARSRVLEGMVKSEPSGAQEPDAQASDEIEELLKFLEPDLEGSTGTNVIKA